VSEELLVIERLAAALEKCASVDEIKDVRDRAMAVQLYARKKAGGLAAAQSAGRVVTQATMMLARLYAEETPVPGRRTDRPADSSPEVRPVKLVVIESPYAGDVERNLRYLRACLRDSLLRGEAPFASHGLYTQAGVLDDLVRADREMGMHAGWAWMQRADLVAVYEDFGISSGMRRGIAMAVHVPVEYRSIGRTG
jgi:hypothetical protein